MNKRVKKNNFLSVMHTVFPQCSGQREYKLLQKHNQIISTIYADYGLEFELFLDGFLSRLLKLGDRYW